MAIPTEMIPRLEHGDRLRRSEFERRRDTMFASGKVELVEGVVHISSHAFPDNHARLLSRVVRWLEPYRAATPGVREYIVWRVLDRAIDWFIFREGNYERLAPDANGIYESEVFPGLWLDAAALLRGELVAVMRVLQHGLASPAYATFIARLQQKAAGGG